MLTIFVGIDPDARLKSVDELLKKNDAIEVVILPANTVSPEILHTYLSGQSLFGSIKKIYIPFPQDNEVLWEYIIENASTLHDATVSLILSERELSKSDERFLNSTDERIIIHTDKATKTSSSDHHYKLSPFVLSDALFAKDKKGVWTTYSKLKEEGTPDQEIENVILWSIKSLLLVYQTKTLPKNEQKLTLKPFVLSKIERGLSSWKKEALFSAYKKTILCISTHRFKEDYDLHLEKLLLEILS